MSYSGKFKDKNNNLHPVTSVLYGTCDTAAATAAKVVTCSDFDTLMTGVTIRVKFANVNTAASPTVNINSTGAKSVYRFGSTDPVDGNSWNAGEVVELVYDGTSFFMTGADDIAAKQNATDNSLQTTDKTVVGAINEHEGDIGSLKSGLTNLDNEVNGDATTYPYADVITIPDAVPANLADCKVKIEPIQDLHGYANPWVGGASKNKLPLVLADLKTANTDGTWNDNVYTVNNGTFTVNTDDGGNVTSIKANGTFNANSFIIIEKGNLQKYNGMILNGCPSGGSGSTYNIKVQKATGDYAVYATDTGNGYTLPDSITSDNAIVFISINGGYNAQNLMFYPMIRLSTETDTAFAPYTNICPITGYTEASVQRDGKNWFDVGNSINDWIATNMDGAKISSSSISSKVTATISRATGSVKVTNYDTTNWLWMSKELKFQKNTSYKLRNISGIPMKIFGFNSLDAYTIGTQIVPTDGVYNSGDYDYWITSFFPNNLQFENAMIVLATETDATFEPYQGKTYTLALGDTIYGGTVDFDSGVMTAKYVSKTFDENVVLTVGTSQSSGLRYADIVYSQNDMGAKRVSDNYMICSSYAKIDSSDTPTYGTFRVYSDSVAFLDEDFVDVASAKAKLNGVQLVYELATPLTIQLTPQQIQLLKGTNTLTASTGDISVTVNGVSGSIGAMQEQVNGLAEDVALKQNATDNSLETEAKTIVGAINEHEGDIGTLKSGLTNLSKGYFKASVTSGKWYKIADMTASTWIIHSGIIAIGGVLLKKFTFRYDATNHTFNNNFTKLESITGLPGYMAMKFGDNAVTLYYKAGQIGTATYSVLTDGEEGAVNYYNFVETDLTDADMDLIES